MLPILHHISILSEQATAWPSARGEEPWEVMVFWESYILLHFLDLIHSVSTALAFGALLWSLLCFCFSGGSKGESAAGPGPHPEHCAQPPPCWTFKKPCKRTTAYWETILFLQGGLLLYAVSFLPGDCRCHWGSRIGAVCGQSFPATG